MPQDHTGGASPRWGGSRAHGQHGEGLAVVVRARRLAEGLTQQQLAALAGVSVAALRDLEQGRTRQPRPGLVAKLAGVLGLDQAPARRPGWAVRGVAGVASPNAGTLDARPVPVEPPGGWAVAGSLWLRVLGPLAVWRDGVSLELSEPKQRAVLGVLAVQPNTPVYRDALIDAVWEEDPPATAVGLVQAYVSRLRRVLDPGRRPHDPGGLLVSTGTSYRLCVTADELDLVCFVQLADRAREARDAGQVAAAIALYQRALALWQGAPLDDVGLLRVHPAVINLSRRHAVVIAEFAEVAIGAGRAEQVLPDLEASARREPLNERVHALLMLALAGCGQQAAALQLFQDQRVRLDDQLGVRPGPELADAHLRVLRQQLPTSRHRASQDASVPPSSPPAVGLPAGPARVVPRQLPTAVRHFAGRTRELDALGGLLDQAGEGGQAGGAVVISAIGGTAGVGKTALAIHWAHQVRSEEHTSELQPRV